MIEYEGVRATHDPDTGSWYFYIQRNAGQAHNGGPHHRTVVFDYDANGDVQGIEII